MLCTRYAAERQKGHERDRVDLDSTEESRREAERARASGPPLGEGMRAPDSTQAPLSAETGEPDEAGRGERHGATPGQTGDTESDRSDQS